MAEEKKEKPKEGEPEGEQAAAATKAGSKKKLYIMVGAGVALLVCIVVLILALQPKAEVDTHQLEADAAVKLEDSRPQPEAVNVEEELLPGEEPLGAFLPLETFILNLSGGKYIRMQMQYEFNGRDIPKRLYAHLVPLRDTIISLITSKTAEDLLSEKGKETLRAELRDMVNEMLKKEEVKKVYFTQFVIQ